MRQVLRLAGFALLGMVGVVTAALVVLELGGWKALRGPVGSLVEGRTGRAFAIRGDLDVELGLVPRIHAQDVVLGNASWVDSDEPLAQAERVELDVRLLELLRGRVSLPRLVFDRPRANLRRLEDGRANWELREEEGGEAPRIGALLVREGRLRLDDAVRGVALDASVDAGPEEGEGNTDRLRVAAQGRYNGDPFRLTASGGALHVHATGEKPYPLDFELLAGETRLRFDGTLGPRGMLEQVNGQLAVRGPDLEALYALTGLVFPNTPPYTVRARIRRDGEVIRLTGLEGSVGDSDTAGDLRIRLGEPRPHLRAELRSRQLHLYDLAALLGAKPEGDGAEENGSPSQEERAGQREQDARLLPDATLQAGRLGAMDASVDYRAESVRGGAVPLRQVHLEVELESGVLQLKPASFRFPEGALEVYLTLDGTRDPAASELDLRLKALRLDELLPRVQGTPALTGTLTGRAALSGRGNSVRSFAANAEGRMGLAMDGGRMSHLVVELIGLDVAEALGVSLGEGETVSVRCAAVALEVRDGRAEPRSALVDTSDSLIVGRGHIDLEAERLDLTVEARSKGASVLAGQSPVTITGPLRRPRVGVEAESLAGRTAAAVALGALFTPIASVLAFVDPGLAEDSDCAARVREAKSMP